MAVGHVLVRQEGIEQYMGVKMALRRQPGRACSIMLALAHHVFAKLGQIVGLGGLLGQIELDRERPARLECRLDDLLAEGIHGQRPTRTVRPACQSGDEGNPLPAAEGRIGGQAHDAIQGILLRRGRNARQELVDLEPVHQRMAVAGALGQ